MKLFSASQRSVVHIEAVLTSNQSPVLPAKIFRRFIIESASYCAWGALGEREREREIQREKDGSDVTLVALAIHLSLPKICTSVLAKSFALFLSKKLHLSLSPLEGRWVHTFRCQKRCTLPEHFAVFVLLLSNGVTGDRSKQTIEFPAALSFFSLKKWIKLIPKTIGNRKEIVREVALGG